MTVAGTAVTGMGAVSALGAGCRSLRDALDEGRDGIGPIARFSTGELTVHLGGMVPGANLPELREDALALCVRFAVQAAREAWAGARVAEAGLAPERIALVLGTSIGGHVDGLHDITAQVGEALGAGGPRLTVSTACASSAGAIDLARRLLQRGDADLVLAGGADVLTAEVFAGFHALGLLSPQKCAPFSEPYGTTLGEGAGLLVLESAAQARRRGIRPRAFVDGSGLSCDAYHPTTPEPSGAGVARALRAALADAGMTADRIGYVNAHGTGTQANDIAEWKAVRGVLGAHAEATPISATKSFLGHAQGAAGVLEIIATILCMERGLVPPTLHHTRPRPFSPPDPVAGDRPRPVDVAHAACISSAFGGANAVVVASREERTPQPRAARPVYLLGTGEISSPGVDDDVQGLVPRLDPRGLDPATRFLVAASARALRDADISVRGTLRDRAGLFVGALATSATSTADFRRSIEERGLAQLSATAFTRLVLNAAAGVCCQALGLRAATTTVSIGPNGGLLALLYAIEHLSGAAEGVDLMLAGAFDEPDGPAAARGDAVAGACGAACVVLGSAEMLSAARRRRFAVRAAGWSAAGPGQLGRAVTSALERSGTSPSTLDAIYLDAAAGALDAAAGALWHRGAPHSWPQPSIATAAPLFAVAAACEALQAGRARTALVGTAAGRCASLALILCAEEMS